jgi:hypothetical protein
MPHDVAIDLEAATYMSCLGRQYLKNSPRQPTIDGLYTAGQVDGNAQLIFRPLYGAPPVKLELPAGVVAKAIASSRKSRKDDKSTDLYVFTTDGGLYYFASTNQTNSPDGTPPSACLLFKHAMFNGVRKMYVHQQGNCVVVWGLNGNNQLFYTSCGTGQETSPAAWSSPATIATNVDLFSPYINHVNNGKTFFAVAENTLQKLTKSPQTSLWKSESITLPVPETNTKLADTQKYSSYTTRIVVTDEKHQPVAHTPLTISAKTRTGVYINHLYYVLDPTGVVINTDELGTVTIVEWVNTLTGTRLKVSGLAEEINPMDTAFKRGFSPDSKTNLNSRDSLRNATISDDKGGTPTRLVKSNVTDNDLDAVANSNKQFNGAYDKLLNKERQVAGLWAMDLAAVGDSPVIVRISGVENVESIFSDIGDFFRWLASKIEEGFEILLSWVGEAWKFIVTIAEKTYEAVLSVVEHVIAGVEWVLQQIKTAIEDVIKFVGYLFGWDDILQTHNVMKSVFIHLVDEATSNLTNYKTYVGDLAAKVKGDLDKWAGMPVIEDSPNSTANNNKAPDGVHSGPSNVGVHHYQGNASNTHSDFSPAKIAEEIYKKLADMLGAAKVQIQNTFKEIDTQIIQCIHELSVTEIIKRFINIVVKELVDLAVDAVDTTIDILIFLIQAIKKVLTEPINIPVISWLYHDLTGNDLTFLDVICLIAAIPATIVYKLISNGVAPFPKGSPFANRLLNAKNFDDIRNAFFTAPATVNGAVNTTGFLIKAAPVLDGKALKIFTMITGIYATIGSVTLIISTTLSRSLISMDEPTPKEIGVLGAVGNIAYVSPNISTFINVATDNWYQQLNNALTGVSVLRGFLNIFLKGDDANELSALAETCLNVAWNVPVIDNIVDNAHRYNNNYKALIPESIGNFCFNLGGIMEFPITLDPDKESKGIASIVQFAFMGLYGIFMPIAAGIYMGDDQTGI